MSEDRPQSAAPEACSASGSSTEVERLPRRSLLRILGGTAGFAAVSQLGGLSGCGPRAPQTPPAVEVPLTSLPEGERVRVMMGPNPIEVVRVDHEVRARSLWCTHLGCEVRWNGEEERYLCPCHGGQYDARGYPVAGPPPRRLRELQVTLSGEIATITPAVSSVPDS